MLSPTELYHVVRPWLYGLGISSHATAVDALGHLVTALLVGQSLRRSAVMRALPSLSPVPARQRFKRVARAWTRCWLSPAWLTPHLVRAAVALVPPDAQRAATAGLTHLALDSVRCGPWESFTLGVVWCGRVLPVGWAVLPYPWPKGQFTPTVCALIAQVAAVWPASRPAHLVADRAFPSRRLFHTLRGVGWGWTVRLRARTVVTVAGQASSVRALLSGARVGWWTVQAACYGSGPAAVAGTLVLGRGVAVVPWHQRGKGSQQHSAARHARRQRHLATKHPGRRPDASAETDAWMVLFSSHGGWQPAVCSYRRRWATEGSYRDAQGGWDGQHGWDLEAAVERLTTRAQVERVVGLWALGTLLQTWVGSHLGHAPAPVQAVVRQWTTTGRLSVWARGRLALTEPSGQLRDWVTQTMARGLDQVLATPWAAPPPFARAREVRTPDRKAA